MLKKINDFTKEISYEAGKILLKGFRSNKTIVSYKSRTDLVTDIDEKSEKFLFEKINKEFSDHSIVAEEGSRKDTKGEFIWYVDPIDGTNNFAHGLPFFCISIGVFSRELNSMVSGVVYNPFLDELFSAIKNSGSTLNGEKISVSKTGDIGISILATGFPYEKDNPEINNLKEFNEILPNVQGIRRFGSAALDLCYLACGRFDGYWEHQLKPWDMAAGSLIAEEAGGVVTDYSGQQFDPEKPQLVASNGKIHEQILKFIKKK
jgi:myo-inositol-1(or 4)-monophosphatase